MKILKFYRKNKIIYTIRVNGNCMFPVLKNGDIVSVYPCEQYRVGDIILCVDGNGIKYIHRIYDIVDGEFITKADNNICIDRNPIPYDKVFGKIHE